MTKQAVVIVHGMGEQRPMGTMRDLVKALAPDDKTFIIPDESTGSAELSRIRVTGPNDGDRTDFFELYYADLLGSGSFAQLRGWVLGLLLRWPHQVPREVWRIWAFLWAAVLFTLVWLGPLLADDPMGKVAGLFKVTPGHSNNPSQFQMVLIALASMAIAIKLALMARNHVDNADTKPDIKRTLSPYFSYILPAIVSAMIGWFLWVSIPWSGFSWPTKTWCQQTNVISCGFEVVWVFFSLVWVKLLVAALLWFGVKNFGVSYFGDVARYVDTSHIAIESRSAIRERAVRLLAALHDRRAFEKGTEKEEPEYERIVIIAHSLGSVVAYDAMRIFWAQRNHNKSRVIPPKALQVFRDMETLVGATPGIDDQSQEAVKWDQAHYDLQKKAFDLFGTKNPDWRISDFLTLGSPLARADFLMSRDLPRFRTNTANRQFPTSPPVLEEKGKFLFDSAKAGGVIPHHGAMFSVTQWLAIFDPVRGLLFGGDFIGGPVRFLFGRGVSELAVNMRRTGIFFPTIMTHTNYWDTNVSTELDVDKTHISQELREKLTGGEIIIAAIKSRIWK